MDWLALTPAVLVAAAVLVVPGTLLGLAVGLRGLVVVAAAAPLGATLIGCSAVLLDWFGIRWSVLPWAVACVVVTVVALLLWLALGLVTTRPVARTQRVNWLALLAGGATATAGFYVAMSTLFPTPSYFAQTFDNTFHLNVVRYILDSGHASSLTIGAMTSGGNPPAFYPGGIHAYIALVVQLTGLPIGTAQNAVTMAATVVGWGLGCLALTQVVAGVSITAACLTGALIGTTYLFPWMFIWSGGLYPNLFANTLLPGAITLLVLAAQRSAPAAPATGTRYLKPPRSPRERARLVGTGSRALIVVCLVGTLPGVALAHPNSAFTLLAAAVIVGFTGWLSRIPRGASGRRWLLWVGAGMLIGASTLAFATGWVRLAPGSPTAIPGLLGVPEALGVLVQGGAVPLLNPVPSVALSIAVMAGLVGTAVRREFAPILLVAVAVAAFVVAFGGPDPAAAIAVSALFYNDINRVTVAVLILSLPALTAGVGMVCDLLHWVTDRITGRRWLAATLRGLAAAGLAVPVAATIPPVLPAVQAASVRFVVPSEDARFFSAEEYALMSRMPSLVPSDARVVADPGTGGAYIYSISGTKVVFTHIFVTDSPAMNQLRLHMFDKAQLPNTCAAVAELNAYYFYTSDRSHPKNFTGPDYFPGLYNPPKGMLKEIAAGGDATLYRFVACDN